MGRIQVLALQMSLTAGARRRARWRNIEGWLFVLPVVLGLLTWTLIPFVTAFYFSLTRYDMLSTPIFIGLKNYNHLWHDALFWQSVKVTLSFAAMFLPLSMIIGLGMAILLNQNVRGIGLLRTAFYIPSIVPLVATSVLWIWLLNPQDGLVNLALKDLHLPTGLWLTDPGSALPSLVLISLWSVGGGMIVYLAGLQGVPEEYYEAAKIDGAGALSQFRHITLPIISPTLFYQLVLGLIASMQYFTQAFVLGGTNVNNGGMGEPLNSTLFQTIYIYQIAFNYYQMGYACALSVALFVMILALTLIVFGTQRFWVFYGDR
jgi:multiple sugar transport system permease protein